MLITTTAADKKCINNLRRRPLMDFVVMDCYCYYCYGLYKKQIAEGYGHTAVHVGMRYN